ncbi:MAG: UDP-N-acetylmuramate dehydrogenase [Flavobacteriaceae bacterium]|jgi:UDP-N-acetylmuramate dehydrogenase|nr:UDP-N-acetylmuramate dehydrogenase [Flavobacteriaceae bacterium]
MINIQENIDIKELTTFKVPALCHYFTEVYTPEELNEAISFAKNKKLQLLFLGGGSNILFTDAFRGLIIKLNLKGIKESVEDEEHVIVSAQAGEEWNSFVQYCIVRGYGGLENLSLIPGNVGTSPMQNIGAYGVEMKDTFYSLQALNIKTQEIETFTPALCKFGYRESFFKNEGKDQYVILEVKFKLTRKNHKLTASYGAIQEKLNEKNIIRPTLKDISDAVVQIRKSKLPDPEILGNAGSFFKNPILPLDKFQQLQKIFPTIPHYRLPDRQIKIPAGWLIEHAGWKGKKTGDAGVHEKQALVLVNYGKATGKEIFQLSEIIIQDVDKIFNIQLQREVNIII